jgi:hypothetical protein
MMRLGEAFAFPNVRERWRGTSVRSRLVAAGLAAALVTALVVSVLARGGAEEPTNTAAAANTACGYDNRVAGNPLLAGGHAPGGVVAAVPPGTIPAIDHPRFESPAAARGWLGPKAPVVVARVGTQVRAYPAAILLWHEVVNDVVGGLPLLVTFCPLCNTAMVYERVIRGRAHELEVSGELALGAAVLYDRSDGLRYAQPTGKPLGPATRAADPLGLVQARPPSAAPRGEPKPLRWYPSDLMTLDQAAAANPNLVVLSRDTGYARDYGASPYGRIGKLGSRPSLYDGFVDTRLDPKTRLVGVVINKVPQAWLYEALRRERVRNDTLGGKPVVILFREDTASIADSRNLAAAPAVGSAGVFSPTVDGRALHLELGGDGQISDRETGSSWDLTGRATSGPLAGTRLTPLPHLDTYWYAWAGRYPDTRVWPPLPPGCSGR